MSAHVHECPQCHERPACSDACDIDPDLSRDRPTGAHAVCDSCEPPVSDYARGRADAKREAIALVEGYREHALPGAERQTLDELLRDLEKLR